MPANGAKPLHIKLREKRNRPDGPFIWMTRELLESDAWRTAPINTVRFVMRLMIEHMAHAGTENGNLICTFDDLSKWGVGRRFIVKAQKEAIRRGLVYRTQKGCRSAGAGRRPHRFGLGWLPGHDGSAAPSRWKLYQAKPKPRPGLPPVDINSSTPLCTKLKRAKLRVLDGGLSNKVHKGAPDKVHDSEPGEMNFDAQFAALITYASVDDLPRHMRRLFPTRKQLPTS
jgi:hypothetical protein